MSRPLKTSKALTLSYSKSKDQDLDDFELDIRGRAPSVLTYAQGDHVTAHRLIEEGLFRSLSPLTNNEVEALFDLKNRNNLRTRRGLLYDYVSAIAVLDPDPRRRESLYQAIDEALLTYNKERHRKTEIKQNVVGFHRDPSLSGVAYKEALKGQEARFRENGEKLRDLFCTISALILTFYNKIPHTAYHYIDGFEEAAGDIKASITKIGRVLTWMEEQRGTTVSSSVFAVKRSEITKVMTSLIHYPEITDRDKLTAHESENIDKKGKTNQPRNNSKETLIMILSRHIHIFFSVYPELKRTFNRNDELIDDFVDKFIGRGTQNPNWPSFTRSAEIRSIKEGVRAGVLTLEQATTASHYTNWKAARQRDGYDLDSSDDEDIPTKPMTKTAPTAARQLAHSRTGHEEKERMEEMMRELEQLRALKDVILRNRDSIPSEVMEEVDSVLSASQRKKPIKVLQSKERSG